MGIKRSVVALGLVLGVMLAGCATFVTGTTCEEITMELCTALPYTQTGFPNSLGHASHDQIPRHLSSTFATLITIGCYDNMQLFLCAAAFPQCTTSGQLLPPCRSLCENAVSGCGFWLTFYSDIFDGISCEAMPNSSDPSVCVGLNTSPFSVTMVTSEQSPGNTDSTTIFETTVRTNVTNSTRVHTSETLFATPSPRQPRTTSSNEDEDEDGKSEGDTDGKPANSTLLNLASPDLTSEVKVQGSTETKGSHRMTDSVDKSVKTDINFQDDSSRQSTLPVLGITLSVLSCAGMVLLLMGCVFFRKAFGKPFGGRRRRKPRDGAFYTNPAFSDLPRSAAGPTGVRHLNGQSLGLQQQPYTLADLPPHPASADAPSHHHRGLAEPNIYQQEPGGFTEQNLFVAPHPPDCPNKVDHRRQPPDSKTETEHPSRAESRRVTSDLVYSNKVTSVTMDTNANERDACANERSGKNGTPVAPSRGEPSANERSGKNGTPVAPSRGEPFPVGSTNVDDGDMVIANPIAC